MYLLVTLSVAEMAAVTAFLSAPLTCSTRGTVSLNNGSTIDLPGSGLASFFTPLHKTSAGKLSATTADRLLELAANFPTTSPADSHSTSASPLQRTSVCFTDELSPTDAGSRLISTDKFSGRIEGSLHFSSEASSATPSRFVLVSADRLFSSGNVGFVDKWLAMRTCGISFRCTAVG